MFSLAPGSSVVPRGRLSPVTARGVGSVETSGRHLSSTSAITSRSLNVPAIHEGSSLADQCVVTCIGLTTNTCGSSVRYREVIPFKQIAS